MDIQNLILLKHTYTQNTQKNSRSTSPKTNMTMEIPPFEDVFRIENGDVPMFRGVHNGTLLSSFYSYSTRLALPTNPPMWPENGGRQGESKVSHFSLCSSWIP